MDHRLGLGPAEEVGPVDCPVSGDLPAWLDGTLLRNGPGSFAVGEGRVNHWFDGLALLRRFDIADDGVTLTTRYPRSEAYRARKQGRLGAREFGTDPDRSVLAALRDIVDPAVTDNASISVAYLADRWLALTETPNSVAFDPETLDTECGFSFDDTLAAEGSGGLAHLHRDASAGETWGFATRLGRERGYALWKLPDGDSEREVVGTVDRSRPAYIHSFWLTDDYAVLFESPYRLHLPSLLYKPFADAFEWTDRPARLLVFRRDSGRLVAEPELPPAFVFHGVNAYETDDGLVVDSAVFAGSKVMDAFRLDRLDSPEFTQPTAEFRRYRVPLDRRYGNVTSETLHPGPFEFPGINYGRRGRRYRYAYGVGAPTDDEGRAGFADRLLKVDIETETTTVWDPPNCFVGEPLFVPRPDAEAEDDGVVLAVALDADEERSFLAVLDAESFEERARATAPVAVPFGFHGQFVPRGERYCRSND